MTAEQILFAYIVVVVILLSVFLQPVWKARRKYKKEFLFRDRLTHFGGLHLPEGVKCEVICLKSRIIIEANSMEFSLPEEKIVDVSIVKRNEVQKIYGHFDLVYRARIVNKNNYLVFTYVPNLENETETQCIIFGIPRRGTNASRFKSRFQRLNRNTGIRVNL